jgi:signal transduction histidine kinase
VDQHDAVQELRDRAHGFYPPGLMDRGLVAALASGGGGAALPVAGVSDGEGGRFAQDVEAAVYFCCVAALPTAGKHAGDGARVVITIERRPGELAFAVADDGAGFDAGGMEATAGGRGHGFVNMSDRLGAIGGTLTVESAPGAGTTISGVVPIVPGAGGDPA